jgi:hypothetical protein
MAYATDGQLPKDIYGSPANGVYIPNVGTVAAQGGTPSSDGQGQPSAPMIVQLGSTQAVNGTLQNAAAANGNGTPLSLLGMSSIIYTVTQTGFTGTVNFECTEDNTNWDPLQVTQEGTNTILTAITGATTTATHLYEGSVAGLQSVRARVSGFSAGTVTVTAHAIPITDAPRVMNVNAVAPYPATATPITAASGNVAAATAAATLAAVAGKTTYITGFAVTGSGATAGLPVSVTVTNTITGTLTYTYAAAAGVLVANTPLIVQFPYPIPASAANTTIVVSCPTLGAGNTNNATVAYGFQL